MRLIAIALLAMSPLSWAQDEVLGRWAGPSSILEITRHGDRLSARVVALKDPTYLDTEAVGTPGEARLDDRNPNPDLQTRPILGLELLSGYRHTGRRWEGKIYDPESGNTYASRMEVDDDGNLKMRGYIGIALLGRTAIFQPLSACTEVMRQMLARSNTSAAECAAP